jgi:hypothetical protein
MAKIRPIRSPCFSFTANKTDTNGRTAAIATTATQTKGRKAEKTKLTLLQNGSNELKAIRKI